MYLSLWRYNCYCILILFVMKDRIKKIQEYSGLSLGVFASRTGIKYFKWKKQSKFGWRDENT